MLTRPVPKSARIGALGTITILLIAAVLLPMARAERTSQETPVTRPAPSGTASASLVGHWTFDETNGTVAKDTSGKGNDGIVVGNPNWVTGKIGGALEFDGSTYVNCGNKPSLNLRDQITMSFWFKVAAFQNPWEAFLAKGDSAYRASRSSRTADSVLRGTGNSVHMGIAFYEYFDANSPIVTDNQWHHYAGTYDGTTATIYVDGVVAASQPFPGQIGDSNAYDLYIGENAQQPGRKLHGVMDDVRIYGEALNAQQVKDLMTKGTFAPVPSAKPAPRERPHEPDKVAVTTGVEGTILDPKTRLEFRVARKITGENDIIQYDRLRLSPNGKFLLWEGRVVPLDGSPASSLKELQGAGVESWSASWSPDGRKIAYNHEGIEVLPVSPDSGRPTGPARKILDEKGGWFRGSIYWSADSEQILFWKYNRQWEREVGTISLRDGRLNKQPEYADFALVSPDGKTIAYSMPDDGIWTQALGDGPAKIARPRSGGWLCDDPVVWTSDSQWIVSAVNVWHQEEIHFARLSDAYNLDVFPPETVGTFIGKSTDGKKLYFYRCSFDMHPATKVVPVSGGPASSMSPLTGVGEVWDHAWTSDSGSLAVLGMDEKTAQQLLWSVPLTGGDRVRFDLKSLEKEDRWVWSLSPDGSKLLCLASPRKDQASKEPSLYVIPISLKEGRATGPATLVFEGWKRVHGNIAEQAGAWSLDGTRIVLPHKSDQGCELWVSFADGSKPVRIAQTPYELGPLPIWSPDGKMIAFNLITPDREMIQVVPAEGGTLKTVLATPRGQSPAFCWSPDSKEVAVACDGAITGFPVTGGSTRVIVRLQEAGYESASWLCWSPDGQRLAFYGGRKGEASRLCLFSPDTNKIAALENSPESAWSFAWSPDSKMISCTCEEAVKIRPAGIVRELDVAEAVQKAPPVAESKPAEIKPIPPAEPVAGPVFSDNFDNGPSKCWRFQDLPDAGLGPGWHAVENGELLLSHSRAILDVLDWTDYIVTVRICLKEVVATPGDGNIGIEARAVRSQFGSSRMDRYGLGLFPNSNIPPCLWMGINYADASDTLRHGMLGRSPCSIVKDKWYTLEFELRGQHLRAYLDGKLMIEATDARLSKGILWIGTSKSRALFDDFSVRRLP